MFLFNTRLPQLSLRVPLLPTWTRSSIYTSLFSTLRGEHPRPKRPMNAYLLYLQEERIHSDKTNNREIVRSAALKWRELSETAKKPYLEKQRELFAKYHEDVASYKALLSVEEKQEFLDQLRQKKTKRHKRVIKKLRKESGMPKRNRSAFAFYLSSCYASMDVHSRVEAMEIMKELRNQWSLMFEYQKKPFEEQALKDKERYDREMREYMDRMKDEGKLDILPVKYQKQIRAQEKRDAKAGKA